VSIKRLSDFLQNTDLDKESVQHYPQTEETGKTASILLNTQICVSKITKADIELSVQNSLMLDFIVSESLADSTTTVPRDITRVFSVARCQLTLPF